MKTKKIFEEWISAVDLTKTYIVKFPSYIFLCGGRISDTSQNKFLSCRDLFYSYVKENEASFYKNIVLAEKIFEYFDHSEYEDLLSFEKDLAELSALTIIFSESPGSIAELGLFSMLKTLQNRLLIVMHKDDTYQESFIWRGPVKFLKNLAKSKRRDDPITIYNWEKKRGDNGQDIIENFSDADDLSETIDKIIRKYRSKAGFKKDEISHIMMLIISSLNIVQPASSEDILFILKAFGIEIELKKVKQYLSLLKSLDLIDLHPYRNHKFYFAATQDSWLKWGYNSDHTTNRDATRWISLFADLYRNKDEYKDQGRALRSYLTSTKQIGD